MTEKVYESQFHKWYVGGQGRVELKPLVEAPRRDPVSNLRRDFGGTEDINDYDAQLPEEIMEELRKLGKI
jgi:hypothetical protein